MYFNPFFEYSINTNPPNDDSMLNRFNTQRNIRSIKLEDTALIHAIDNNSFKLLNDEFVSVDL